MLKKIFIPGWFDVAENRVDFDGLNIWLKRINYSKKIDSEYIVGHSFGANFALLNWEKNKNAKLILINPSIPQDGFFNFFMRWLKFLFGEGSPVGKKRIKCFFHPYLNIKQGLELVFKNYEKIIDCIPKNEIILMRGENDKYFFDEVVADKLRLKGIKILEIEGAGHSWNKKFNQEINKLIN
jgi:hypothetical protein